MNDASDKVKLTPEESWNMNEGFRVALERNGGKSPNVDAIRIAIQELEEHGKDASTANQGKFLRTASELAEIAVSALETGSSFVTRFLESKANNIRSR
jgi:hypothetical protein